MILSNKTQSGKPVFSSYVPQLNTRLRLNSSVTCFTCPGSLHEVPRSFTNSATVCSVMRLMLRCHDVEPVPVLTHIPELFTLVQEPPLRLRPKYETRDDRLSPTYTFNKMLQRSKKNEPASEIGQVSLLSIYVYSISHWILFTSYTFGF